MNDTTKAMIAGALAGAIGGALAVVVIVRFNLMVGVNNSDKA